MKGYLVDELTSRDDLQGTARFLFVVSCKDTNDDSRTQSPKLLSV